ncbi:KAR4 [Sanghuangporus weigelae]
MSTAEVLSSASDLLASHASLFERVRSTHRANRRALREYTNKLGTSTDSTEPLNALLSLPLIQTPPRSPTSSPTPPHSPNDSPFRRGASYVVRPNPRVVRSDLPPAKKARCARYMNYIPEEETIRNDYSQRYVDGGEWPQNWVVGAEMERRFEEYPKQQRLLQCKKAAVSEHAVSSSYLSLSASQTALQGLKFDVILIDPPFSSSFTWEQLESLPIASLAADPSFVFLWVGSGAGEGLERGREILGKWGYRRCEDICWVKTNKGNNKGPGTDPPTTSLLTRTKQHCLMGIRGTVRRSTDSWFVHCNIDTDVIFWEGDSSDPTRKPPEMYQLIENFCLGTRRLELFGRYHSLRRGWVTVTADELELSPEEAHEKDDAVPFDRERWENNIKELAQGGKCVVPNTSEIESLRPKSPTPRGPGVSNSVSAPTVTAVPMAGSSAGLPSNPMRTSSSLGGTSGGVSLGSVKSNQNAFRQMNMMNFGPSMPGGNMGVMASSMGGMASGMNSMGNMGNVLGMGGMSGGNSMNMGMATGNMGVGEPMMNQMGMSMNPMMGGTGQGAFNFGFDGGASGTGNVMRPAQGMMGMGMDINNMNMGGAGGGMNRPMGSGMNQIGRMNMSAGTGMSGMGGLGAAAFDAGQGAWMGGGGGAGGNMGQQQFMGGGGMWNAGSADGQSGMSGMGMGMGMNTGMGGMGMGQGMRNWRGF